MVPVTTLMPKAWSSWCCQGSFRDHSRTIQGPFNHHSRTIQGSFKDHMFFQQQDYNGWGWQAWTNHHEGTVEWLMFLSSKRSWLRYQDDGLRWHWFPVTKPIPLVNSHRMHWISVITCPGFSVQSVHVTTYNQPANLANQKQVSQIICFVASKMSKFK